MILRRYNTLPQLTQEIKYLDPVTYEERVGIVQYIEHIEPQVAFVYVASPDKEENLHQDFNVFYRDIIVFDNYNNELEGGVYRDSILGMYGKFVGEQ